MNRFQWGVALTTLAFVLTNCGKSPLTEAQMATMKDLSSSTNKVVRAANAKRTGGAGARAARGAFAQGDEFSSRLMAADCEFETPNLDSGLSSLSQMNFKMGGANCPVTMEIGLRMNGQTSIDFLMVFEVTNAELAALADVTKSDLQGQITIDSGGSSASGVLRGSIHSKKHGVVPIELKMSFSEGSSSIEMTYEFADFVASLEVEMSEDGVTYRLNGQELTAEEFQQFNATTFGGGSTAGLSQSSSKSEFSYTLSENNCSTELQEYPSKEQMCAGLQDNARNNNCALALREQYFTAAQCAGPFQPN